MPRNQVIVKFPTLNDKGGDLSKKWYVEYYYRVPNEQEPRKRRISEGLCTGTAAERYANAERIINTVTEWLKDPRLFSERPDEVTKVLRNDRRTRPEADRYAKWEQSLNAAELCSEYMRYIEGTLKKGSISTYKSELKYYQLWLKDNDKTLLSITQEEVIPFFQYLDREKHLTKKTIQKYRNTLHNLYEWLIKHKDLRLLNPIKDIPNYGCIVDLAPVPMCQDDTERLKAAIEKNDPVLWLACQLQYYCAIRPGQEIRLLKVKDIDLLNLQITLNPANTKNKKKAIVPINEPIAELIQRMGIMNYDRELYVFGKYGIPSETPIGHCNLRQRFNKFRDALGISKDVKFYSWKHTGAISMVNNGVSVWELQHHMRHSSITTTEEYIRQRANQSRKAKDYIDEL